MTSFTSILLILSVIALLAYLINVKYKEFAKHIKTMILVLVAICIVIAIIIYPKDAVESGKDGLLTWFNVVLPALLPFFIGSEILVGLGVVNFIGALLQPLMKPIFNVPGDGAFPFAISVTSGYPVGAKVVSKLRLDNTITQTEAQRLISFCSTSGPLFMIGAVSIGMFNNVSIGPLIAISHYLAAISVGLTFRFYKRKEKVIKKTKSKKYFQYAFKELIRARQKDGRNIGTLMGDAVKEGMNTMLMVGGFIILYSVIIRILHVTYIMDILSGFISSTPFIDLSKEMVNAVLSGIIEMTNGCKNISLITSSSLISKVSMVSFLIGWSGFSIHSQSMTMLGKTDINNNLYMLSKALQGIFAYIYTHILYNLIFKNIIIETASVPSPNYIFSPTWLSVFMFSLKLGFIIILTMFVIGMITGLISKIKV